MSVQHEAPDGIADEVSDRIQGLVRTAVTLGGVAAEWLARERERQARIAARAAGDRAGGARTMWEAERAVAVGRLSQVVKDEWWDRATPGDIQLAWQDAAAWRAHDPRAAGYAERIGEQLMERYGIDPDAQPVSEPADLAAARARRERVAEQVEATVTVQATTPPRPRDPITVEQDVPAHTAGVRLEQLESSARTMHAAGVPADAAEARLLAQAGHQPARPAGVPEQGGPVGGRARPWSVRRTPERGVGR
jgi:hypothetical protein